MMEDVHVSNVRERGEQDAEKVTTLCLSFKAVIKSANRASCGANVDGKKKVMKKG
jgi:hypothetical protein